MVANNRQLYHVKEKILYVEVMEFNGIAIAALWVGENLQLLSRIARPTAAGSYGMEWGQSPPASELAVNE